MKIIDLLRGFVGITVIEEDESEGINIVEAEAAEPEPEMLRRVSPEVRGLGKYKPVGESTEPADPATENMKIEMFSPQNINDCPKMAEQLKAGNPVIINVEYTRTDDAKHIYFFMRGCCYALNGYYQKIGENIFMFSPGSVGVSGINKDVALNNTFSFSWGRKSDR